jgi:sugar/nucleoside kinase (ribokinase family)
MNLWIDTAKDSLDELISRVDLLFLNDDEARMLTGEANLTVAADKIHEMGPEIVMVKRGEHGSSLHYNGHVDFIPPYPARSVFDPTGAGDSFAGGMVGHLALAGEISRRTLREAAFYGTVMASFTIEEFGPEHIARVDGTELSERLGAIQWTLRED